MINPRIEEGIRWRKENKNTVLIYNPNDGRLFITSSLILRILKACDGKNNIKKIKSIMKSLNNREILEILKDLKEKKLLK